MTPRSSPNDELTSMQEEDGCYGVCECECEGLADDDSDDSNAGVAEDESMLALEGAG